MRQGMKWTLLLLAVMIFIMPLQTEASTNNFSVSAVLPDNQVDRRHSYFDLRLEPSDRQTIQILVSNPGDQDIEVSTILTSADTGRNGLIIYQPNDEYDDSLKYPITELAEIRQAELILPAKESAYIDIDLAMPTNSIEGVILGGLVISAEVVEEETEETEIVEETEEAQEVNQGFGLTNKFAYVIGLKITQDDVEADPDFDLIQILPGLVNYRTAVSFKLQNKAPLIVKEMSVSADVYPKGSDQVLRSLDLESCEMAPNSNGSFVIDWEDQVLKAGTYRLKVRAEYSDQTWEWDEAFEVLPEDAADINEEAVYIEKDQTWKWMVLIGCMMLILAAGAFYLGKKSRRD